MNDPKRLRDCAAPGTLERALLASARRPMPTNDQCDALWVALAARVPECGDPSSGGESANGRASTSANAGVAKAVVLGAKGKIAGLVIAISGIAVATVALPPSRRLTTHVEVSAVPRAVRLPEVVNEPIAGVAEAPVTPAQPAASVPPHASAKVESGVARARVGKPTPTTVPNPLREEAQRLLGVRGALRSGDCTGALERLEETSARFPEGALSQEREALAIEALACTGRDVEAANRAAAFLRQYPASPLADAVGRLAQEGKAGN
jgi:hypothetical protein